MAEPFGNIRLPGRSQSKAAACRTCCGLLLAPLESEPSTLPAPIAATAQHVHVHCKSVQRMTTLQDLLHVHWHVNLGPGIVKTQIQVSPYEPCIGLDLAASCLNRRQACDLLTSTTST